MTQASDWSDKLEHIRADARISKEQFATIENESMGITTEYAKQTQFLQDEGSPHSKSNLAFLSAFSSAQPIFVIVARAFTGGFMNIPSLQKTVRILPLVLLAILTLPLIAIAGPGEEANAVIDRWSAAYSSNDPDAVVKSYRPDAILLGTVSPVL